MGERVANLALRGLLNDAGWTLQQLAGAVNRTAAENGQALRLDRSAVGHWLAGRQPRHPVPEFVAEALSRRLGRTVTVPETGLAGRSREPSRPSLTCDVYNLAQATAPSYAQAVTASPRAELGPEPPSRLNPGVVSAAEQLGLVLKDSDSWFGGGQARPALAAYLAHDVRARLRSPAAPKVRRQMLLVASQLSYLCGFMCFDEELHGQAQHYYRLALQLAAEAGDPGSYAVTLRGMSVQARTLGHHRQAVQLAEAAAENGSGASGTQRAFLFGQLAVALAADSDRAGALRWLGAAERSLSMATGSSAPLVGAYHSASFAHQEAAVRLLLGDRDGAVTPLSAAIRLRPSLERRSRAILRARLAELHLARGRLELAVDEWHRFLDDYPGLQSQRAASALWVLRSRLRPFRTCAPVPPLLSRAAAVFAGPHGAASH
jgi:tetratricopeptide (TPR) repeat protein